MRNSWRRLSISGQSAALRWPVAAAASRQDAAGIATAMGKKFNMHKGNGLVRDVFRTRNMRSLPGVSGIGHVRYPTAGSAAGFRGSAAVLCECAVRHHARRTTATWTNSIRSRTRCSAAICGTQHRSRIPRRCSMCWRMNWKKRGTASRSIRTRSSGRWPGCTAGSGCVCLRRRDRRLRMLAFRDPHGIRPLCFGTAETDTGLEYLVASESVAL